MAFEGFDLMIRDKFNNSICVGDKFKHILFDEEEGKIIENKGQIIYSPKYYCFAIGVRSVNVLMNVIGI